MKANERKQMKENKVFSNGAIHLYCGDALELYDKWESPTVIISDGPYGVKGFPGDLVSPNGLDKWYEPHVKRWSELSTPLTIIMVLEHRSRLGYSSSDIRKIRVVVCFLLCLG